VKEQYQPEGDIPFPIGDMEYGNTKESEERLKTIREIPVADRDTLAHGDVAGDRKTVESVLAQWKLGDAVQRTEGQAQDADEDDGGKYAEQDRGPSLRWSGRESGLPGRG
jgi:hypothetical protein